MTPLEIKISLMKVGISQRDIGRLAGDARPSEVSMCISGLRIYPEIRQAIARTLRKPVSSIFGKHHPQPMRRQTRRAA